MYCGQQSDHHLCAFCPRLPRALRRVTRDSMEDVKKRLEFANPFVQHQVCILSASCNLFLPVVWRLSCLDYLASGRRYRHGFMAPAVRPCLIGRASWDLRCAQHEGETGTDECVQMLTEGMEKRSFTRLAQRGRNPRWLPSRNRQCRPLTA